MRVFIPRLFLLCLIASVPLLMLNQPQIQCIAAVQISRDMRMQKSREVTNWPVRAKRWALIIGVDRYIDKQISGLVGAANDANLLAEALVRNAGFPTDQVIVLSSDQPEERQPTRVNILRRLSNLKAVVPSDGLLLMAFAGHGIEQSRQAFLLPSDAQISNDISFLQDTALSVTRIKEQIISMRLKQVILLIDACRSDPTGRSEKPNMLTQAYTQGFNFDVRNSGVLAFATVYATAIGQRAYEYTEKRQGYFSWAIVEGINGAAANERGEVTLAGLITYIQDVVPKQTGIDLGQGKEQQPFAIIEGYKADQLVVAVVPQMKSMRSLSQKKEPSEMEDANWMSISYSGPLKDGHIL